MKNNLYLDMHIIQTVPPSCVNRDDTGSPKTAIYGGTTRARVSSQAWKSAMRKMFRDELFVPEKLGSRTKLVLDMVEKEILNIKPDADARKLAKDVLTKVGFKFKKEKNNSDEKEKTNVLYFISNAQAKSLAEIAVKLSNKEITANDVNERCKEKLTKDNSIDIALFGRMVAAKELKDLNCDAAAQVAHSISTHAVQNEYDYFTAVDDLSPDDTSGAGHLGTVEFNSSTLYRYANVNLLELASSLGEMDASAAARGFVEAFVRSMPTGKQNTFANRTLPSMVYVTLRRDQPVNLCGAFEKPIRAREDGYAAESERRFVEYAKKVYSSYASEPVAAYAIGDEIAELGKVMPLNTLLNAVYEDIKAYLARVRECNGSSSSPTCRAAAIMGKRRLQV